jgi:hypothetical protein
MKPSIKEMTMEQRALAALTIAVRKAQERQWRLGIPVWVWKDGKVVAMPPPKRMLKYVRRKRRHGE